MAGVGRQVIFYDQVGLGFFKTWIFGFCSLLRYAALHHMRGLDRCLPSPSASSAGAATTMRLQAVAGKTAACTPPNTASGAPTNLDTVSRSTCACRLSTLGLFPASLPGHRTVQLHTHRQQAMKRAWQVLSQRCVHHHTVCMHLKLLSVSFPCCPPLCCRSAAATPSLPATTRALHRSSSQLICICAK